jgi:hypothetical protein
VSQQNYDQTNTNPSGSQTEPDWLKSIRKPKGWICSGVAEEVNVKDTYNIVQTIIDTLIAEENPLIKNLFQDLRNPDPHSPQFSNCTLSMVSGYSSLGGSSSVCHFFYKLTGQVNGQNFTVIYETSDKNYPSGSISNRSSCKIHKAEWDNN